MPLFNSSSEQSQSSRKQFRDFYVGTASGPGGIFGESPQYTHHNPKDPSSAQICEVR